MALAPGTRFGPYEVVGPIGAGGMGEVWRARDTRLDREVAIKILPWGLAADEALKAYVAGRCDAVASHAEPGRVHRRGHTPDTGY